MTKWKNLVAAFGLTLVLAPAAAMACPDMEGGEPPRPVAAEILQASIKLQKTDAKSPARVEAALRKLRGVHKIDVQVKNKRATVRYNPKMVKTDDLVAALRAVGMQAWIEGAVVASK